MSNLPRPQTPVENSAPLDASTQAEAVPRGLAGGEARLRFNELRLTQSAVFVQLHSRPGAARRRDDRQPAALPAQPARRGPRVPPAANRARPHAEGDRAAPAAQAGPRPRVPADPRAPRVAVAAHQQRRDPRRRSRSPRRDREDRARLAAEDRDYPTTTISHWILEWVPV